MSSYQVGILGQPNGFDVSLINAFHARLGDLGIDISTVEVLSESEVGGRDRKRPFIGIFFGYRGVDKSDHPILDDLISDSVVLIPIVEDITSVSASIPDNLRHINCFEYAGAAQQTERLASLLLENFRLLRSDRRLFISYRRTESQRIAIQIYEKLDQMGFDVFLDTRGVPPARDFQSVLWHRLADSDVVILLDTPGFRESRWTREELARANATSIQILHVLWPKSTADGSSAFSIFHTLEPADFAGTDLIGEHALLTPTKADAIGTAAESVRARALSARHRYLVDNFCDQARALGAIATVQSDRFIALELKNGKKIAVVPAIGVPSATRYQEIEASIANSGLTFSKVWLIYDERGILDSWLEHVEWLNKHLPVSAVRVSDSSKRIQGEA